MITILKITALMMLGTFVLGMGVAGITKGLGVIFSKMNEHKTHNLN
jgi:hypothetical protein